MNVIAKAGIALVTALAVAAPPAAATAEPICVTAYEPSFSGVCVAYDTEDPSAHVSCEFLDDSVECLLPSIPPRTP